MTKVETRLCPVRGAKCIGKLCAMTSWKAASQVITSGSVIVPITEWICDFSDRVVERV